MRVAVLGVGLIGGSIGLAARERLRCEVVGWGHRPETVERAVGLGAVDGAAGSVAEACAGAEIVFCAAPVAALPGLCREALAASGPETVVTDAGSTKREIVAELGEDERFVGGHPLAGAETAGVENARADLFEGARWYLTPTERTGGILYDRLLATVSHLPHVLANVLVAQAAGELTGGSVGLPDVGPSFRDATRVAGSNPAIWADIYSANAEAVLAAIDDVLARLGEARELIARGDREAIAAWHARSAELAAGLAEDREAPE